MFVKQLLLGSALALLVGCQYTINGNPDVNLINIRVSPIAASVPQNGTLLLSAFVTGFTNSAGVSWSVATPAGDSLASNGAFATYYATRLQGTTSIVASPAESPSHLVQTAITVVGTEDTMFAVSPVSITMLSNSAQQFSIDTITTTEQVPAINWSIVSGPGSVSTSGVYVAPVTLANDSTVVVLQAASASDPTVFSRATIVLLQSTDSIKCFTRDVLPILSANCGMTGCHSASQRSLVAYAPVLRDVKPGDAHASRLYQYITDFNANTRMPPPPAPALPASAILTIGQWINEGAVDCQ